MLKINGNQWYSPVKSFPVSVLLLFINLFSLIVGGGSDPLAKTHDPIIHRIIQVAVFLIGLILIYNGIKYFYEVSMDISLYI